ncbi:MAG: o-succinylbenzoate synthase [Cyclobacteriaceae bacterium]
MLRLEYKDYTLDFKFAAGTSRGILRKHHVMFVKVFADDSDLYGVGEAAPLPNLSIDSLDLIDDYLPELSSRLKNSSVPTNQHEVFSLVNEIVPQDLPSLKMALEVALLDLIHGGRHLCFKNSFYRGKSSIPINGLIWMDEAEKMSEQIQNKLAAGYRCVKMKIGAIDFEQELNLIQSLRAHSDDLIIRVDANGAFPTNEVLSKLMVLEAYNIHSIEQPIMAGQHEAMQLICRRSKVPIALDEELIGIHDFDKKEALLNLIRPQYIILKPTLLGGFKNTLEWMSLADQMNIGWWLTSALESNVALNAIAQFAANYPNSGFQGLGTGQLYHNNIESPLRIEKAALLYDEGVNWQSVF